MASNINLQAVRGKPLLNGFICETFAVMCSAFSILYSVFYSNYCG